MDWSRWVIFLLSWRLSHSTISFCLFSWQNQFCFTLWTLTTTTTTVIYISFNYHYSNELRKLGLWWLSLHIALHFCRVCLIYFFSRLFFWPNHLYAVSLYLIIIHPLILCIQPFSYVYALVYDGGLRWRLVVLICIRHTIYACLFILGDDNNNNRMYSVTLLQSPNGKVPTIYVGDSTLYQIISKVTSPWIF